MIQSMVVSGYALGSDGAVAGKKGVPQEALNAVESGKAAHGTRAKVLSEEGCNFIYRSR